MDEEENLSFDFEGSLDVGPFVSSATVPVVQAEDKVSSVGLITAAPVPAAEFQSINVGVRRSYRQTVCRHWLRGLCMKGEACGFLHQYVKSRMPVCRFFRIYGECHEQDCSYKHANEDINECNMYKMGFCPNGPNCRYRHAKLPGPPPPVEEVLQKIQRPGSHNYGGASNRFFQNPNGNYPQLLEKSNMPPGQNAMSQGMPVRPMVEAPYLQQQQVHYSQQPTPSHNISNGQQNQGSTTGAPLPQGISRYFIVKSCNRENLELSVQQGVWATQRSNEEKLNEAFDSVENVILIFSVNRTQNFQGCAKMTSRIGGFVGGGNWKSAQGTPNYGRNFSLKWLKLCELSFQNTRHLKNPYNENLPVKISRDCQELEPCVGEQLASLLYLERDSELMAISVAAEARREEEKAKGVNLENENPNIVTFEDNEEEEDEEEEESEEEEDESYASFGVGRGVGIGRGGMMWAPLPNIMGGHGMRPPPYYPGMPGVFPPILPYGGGMTPIPDMFGPRSFPPFGPSSFPPFFGPQVGGMGLIMGPGRGPFMGPRGGDRGPIGMQQSTFPRVARKDQKIQSGGGSNQVLMKDLEVEKEQQKQRYQGRGKGRHKEVESESGDEAPRRSRHGESKTGR
ncbi:30-kDa cleavage and polyadenylation specificity factor 30-like [Impatiens glandulifera]|uniref:30-kDa cleavage and polyadenylation specificity factor 30-like n=1 Tax=Impatiens glandulifera TaxID=253017 RepID=UPI001FB0845C|nr:30-kDa cleavage and polyadenylation specificity factor 30-like [Impatiens glandulifera]